MSQKPVAPLRRGEDNIFVWSATTGDVTLSGEQTIDGEDLIAGDYVLVWKQTDATQNGVYQVRSGDWLNAGQIGLVAVRFGSQYKESMFGLTDADTYKQISGAPAVIVVRASSITNVSPTGATVMDGVLLVTDDLVLLAGQSVAVDRGVWKVNTAGAWEKQSQPALVVVAAGTQRSNVAYFLSATNVYSGLGGFYA